MKMKVLGKITLTLGLMIIVSLFLTSCNGVVTPELQIEPEEGIGILEETGEEQVTEEQTTNPSSNSYQNPSTDPVEEQATEEPGTVEVDTTKPIITGSQAPLPNSLGWNNTDVTVSFSCADTGAVQSGIDVNTVAGATLTTEGKDQSVTNTGTCTDVAGNTADPITVSNINIDKTPPVVTITLPGSDKYVLNQSITATWSATDALSGVDSPVSGSVSIDTSSVGTKTFTLPAGTVMDKAGNSSLKVTISYSVIFAIYYFEVDTTKPVITGSRTPLPNSFGWNNTDVTVSFSCADTGAIQSGIDVNTVAGATLTTEGKDQSVTNTGTCTDVAGNTADPVTVSNINIDKTPPTVTVTLPGTGEYTLNQLVVATWSATDALSGVVSPDSGTVTIDTSSVGTKTFTIPAGTAKDKAGNSSPIVTKSYSVIEDTEEPETECPQKWSGLGISMFSTSDNIRQLSSSLEEWVDELLANGFTQLRIEITYWADTGAVDISKSAVTAAVAKGAEVIWGVGAAPATLTSVNWPAFRQGILDAAEWAQDNGVYEFSLGNEEELHNDDTTLTDAQLRTNLKDVATDVQEIFTNGNISYSCAQNSVNSWIVLGKGDIDVLAANEYMGEYSFNNNTWKADITNLVNAFGPDGTYLTEFGLSSISLDTYSEDEAIQAAGITEMIDYIKTSGMTRAIFFCYYDDSRPFGPEGFGVVKDDGDYRLLWNQALLNSESVKFATVPTKTTTASLLGTIALMPKITR